MARKTEELDRSEPPAAPADAAGADAPAAEAPPANGKTARASRRTRVAAPDPAVDDAVAEKLERAGSLAETGAHADAAEAFAAVVALRPDSVPALVGLGNALAAQGKFEAAEKELRRAEKLAPDDAAVHLQLGATLV